MHIMNRTLKMMRLDWTINLSESGNVFHWQRKSFGPKCITAPYQEHFCPPVDNFAALQLIKFVIRTVCVFFSGDRNAYRCAFMFIGGTRR